MMRDHPQQDVLERFVFGQLPAPEMQQVSRHLLAGCPQCRAIAAGLWARKESCPENGSSAAEDPEAGSDAYDEVFDRVFQRIAAREAEIPRERADALKLYEELMQHPVLRQHLLVANSLRFRSPALCELLIDRSHEAGFQVPGRALDLARLATDVAEVLSEELCGGSEVRNSLRARAWAQLGNALRIQGDLAESERAFQLLQPWIERGEVDALSTARVLDLQASLRREQGDFDAAVRLLDRVISIYEDLGQWHLLGRVLKQKSMIYGEAGELEEEMALLRRALDLLDPDEEPRTFLAARHNLIWSLNDAGRSREAYALLFHTRPLYLKTGDRLNLLRLRWLEGRVARGLGRMGQAEVAFREVREAFLELNLDYEAAMASLDLASIYILQSRTAEIHCLAEETLELFQVRKISGEAMRALAVFCAAARMENAGIGLVQEVSDFLKRARNNPDLHFTPPS